MSKHVVALGGGGFSDEESLVLERYILSLCELDNPKVCFIPTASEDAAEYVEKFYAAFAQFECIPSHLSLSSFEGDLPSFALTQNVFYVGGGNTFNMINTWRKCGLDRLLYEAWNEGAILSGISAGSICWFEQGITDSFGPIQAIPCLGFLPGSNCVHYDSEAERRPVYQKLVAEGAVSGGYAAEDGVALHYLDGELHRIVCSRPDAKAFRLEREGLGVVETPVPSEYLGGWMTTAED